MKSSSLITLPTRIGDPNLSAHNLRPSRQRTEIIKLPLSNPPDEAKIRELNELASKYPFCVIYRSRKHELL
jgi:hypothetical protein